MKLKKLKIKKKKVKKVDEKKVLEKKKKEEEDKKKPKVDIPVPEELKRKPNKEVLDKTVEKVQKVIKEPVAPEIVPADPNAMVKPIEEKSDLAKHLLEVKKNTYCGELRRIGKTKSLIQAIKSIEKNECDKILIKRR